MVHGGLFWEDLTIKDIQDENRFHESPPVGSRMEQMLWSDPEEGVGRDDNPRGASLIFGEDVVDTFLEQNKLDMIVRSHECQHEGYSSMYDGKLFTVFSASNYCGIVGNKGAFMVFEKNMEFRTIQFEAKPKEKMARYRMRHAAIENDVISKLLRRIAQHRLALVDHYQRMDKEGDGLISRLQWAEGLKAVLQLNIPFLEFQGYLGLPKLGVHGVQQGMVDYMSFLERYRINLRISSDESQVEIKEEDLDKDAQKAMEKLTQLLYKNRFELQSLFRYFDVNGDGIISLPEFKDGILSLADLLEEPLTERDVSHLITFMDRNSDGRIEYSEFFDSFHIADEELRETVKQNDELKNSLRPREVDVDYKAEEEKE